MHKSKSKLPKTAKLPNPQEDDAPAIINQPGASE